MKGIFKNENVYVYIDTDNEPTSQIDEEKAFIVGEGKNSNILYGGRVKVSYLCYRNGWNINYDTLSLKIDGIEIRKLYSNATFYESSTPSEIVAYLNQIENLGVDSFLENYKQQLQQKKIEFEAFAHFYEAVVRNDVEKIDVLKSVFPNAYKEFEKMVNEI